MQAIHPRNRRTPATANQPTSQTHVLSQWEERVHRFILAMLFTAVVATLSLVIVNRGPALVAQTVNRIGQPINQALYFAAHPIEYR
jgi:hypothetical protein